MTARVVYAVAYAPDNFAPAKMYWRCSCGGDGVDVPSAQLACSSCRQPIRVPDKPTDAPVSSPELIAGVERFWSRAADLEQKTSTAWKLAAYRAELRACGFEADEIRDLLMEAARHPGDLRVGKAWAERYEPPAPVGVRIENYEAGSPEDVAAELRFHREAQ